MRWWHRSLRLATAFAAATAPAACLLAVPLDDLGEGAPAGAGGSGGSGPSSASTASSASDGSTASQGGGDAGGGAGGEDLPSNCEEPADCSPSNNDCIEVFCDDGRCKYVPLGENAPLPSQVEGDCKQLVCDAEGGQVELPVVDPYDDTNPCTEDECVPCTEDGCAGMIPVNTALRPGDRCGDGVCDADGFCVECIDASDCVGDPACVRGQCVPSHCNDDVENEDETGVDCGGSCPGCPPLGGCDGPEDCAEGVCGPSNICSEPTCVDLVENGPETDVDCGGGGECEGCGTGEGCALPADCADGVCSGGTCAAPTCTDGVENGQESDIDCGTFGCGGCPAGSSCEEDDDCASGDCADSLCYDQCSDGQVNGNETDFDCGGGDCLPCQGTLRCGCNDDCFSELCCNYDGGGLVCTYPDTVDDCDTPPVACSG